MASNARMRSSGPVGVPRSWDRRYRQWARQAIESRSQYGPPPPAAPSDGLYQAALVAVLAAVLAGTIGVVMIWLFNVGPVAGVVGSIVCSTLAWWWMARAVRSLG